MEGASQPDVPQKRLKKKRRRSDLAPELGAQKSRAELQPNAPSTDSPFSGTFTELPTTLDKRVLNQLTYLRYHHTTHIQQLASPLIAQGNDTLIRSHTGSGKTLAFAVPAIQRLLELEQHVRLTMNRGAGTLIICVSPTRELAVQTMEAFAGVARPFPWMVTGGLLGGEKKKSEKARLRKGITVLCATPGRLEDHLSTTACFKASHLQMLVMDEADRLLDLGFGAMLRRIYTALETAVETKDACGATSLAELGLSGDAMETSVTSPLTPSTSQPKCPLCAAVNRQSRYWEHFQAVMVSATLSSGVKQMADFCLRGDVKWAVKGASNPDIGTAAPISHDLELPSTLRQLFVPIAVKSRVISLLSLLLEGLLKKQKVLVFLSNCDSVDFFKTLLDKVTWPSEGVVQQSVSRRQGEKSPPTSKLTSVKGWVGYKAALKPEGNEGGEESDSDNENEFGKGQRILNGVPIYKLHGKLNKEDRNGNLRDFSKGTGILLATDVASRGLNLPEVDLIIQVDPPQHLEEYVHRAGRTARLGRRGTMAMFLMQHELSFVDLLTDKGVNCERLSEIQSLQTLWSRAPPYLSKIRGLAPYLSSYFSRLVASDNLILRMARRAYAASLQSYRAFSKELQPHFPSSELHIGQFATSFCLAEAPSKTAAALRTEREAAPKEDGPAGKRPKLHQKDQPSQKEVILPVVSMGPRAPSMKDSVMAAVSTAMAASKSMDHFGDHPSNNLNERKKKVPAKYITPDDTTGSVFVPLGVQSRMGGGRREGGGDRVKNKKIKRVISEFDS
eukprot:GHVN01066126.1.p1 GENE.GHVN01066126.1~~GHVN01066126.1.p1  ORF type:complete len:787 (+),score=94.80 GHVN01066126.1:2257-4617(+)